MENKKKFVIAICPDGSDEREAYDYVYPELSNLVIALLRDGTECTSHIWDGEECDWGTLNCSEYFISDWMYDLLNEYGCNYGQADEITHELSPDFNLEDFRKFCESNDVELCVVDYDNWI